MDGAMSTFGLPPFDIGQDFSIPPHLRNPENFNARFPNARFPSAISNIFRAGDYASKSVSDDHGGRHMDMSNGIEDISEIGDNELPISVAAMNEPYLTSGTTTLGCTQQQHSSLHTTIPPLQSSNFFSDPVTSEADSYSRDMPFASPMDFNIKNEQEPRFHLNPSSAISSISSALQPNKPNIMRSIYGPNLNPSFPDPASQSMYTYIHQTPVSNDSKAPQFYRPFPGFPPFDTPESIQDNHGFSKSDDSRIFSPVPSSHRPQIIDRQKPQGTNRADAHDVEDVDDANRCKNTVEGTKTSVRRLKKWYKDKYGKSIDMNTVTRQMALEMLKDFFLEIRDTRPGKEGNEYEPVTLTTYRNGLRRYFLERKCPPAVENFDLADREFDVVNYGLVSKRNELKRKGKGNHPNVVESITEEQLERMWASGAIGVHAPRPLLRLQWWINTVSHGIRGRMAHHDLSIDDFRISRGPDGKIIIDHMKAGNKRPRADEEKDNPRSKKKCKARVAATDGSERDPVRAFEVYLRHRPPGISSFYLTPKHKPKGDIWFNKVPMGKNSIGRIMREIKAIAGLLAAAFRCQLAAAQNKQSSSSVEEQQLYQLWLHGASCLSAMLQVCLMCFVPSVTEDSWDIVPSTMCFVLLNIGAWTSVAAARSLQEHVVSDKSSAVALQLPVDMEPVDVIDVSVAETELEEICSICLRPLATEPLRRLHCGHAFHQGCIDAWLRTVTRGETRLCPMRCENPVQVRTAPPVTAPGVASVQRNRLAAAGGA